MRGAGVKPLLMSWIFLNTQKSKQPKTSSSNNNTATTCTSQMKTRNKSTKESDYRDTSGFDSSDNEGSGEESDQWQESDQFHEGEGDERVAPNYLHSEEGKRTVLQDIESVGGPWNCTRANRQFSSICDNNEALYGKPASNCGLLQKQDTCK